MNNRPEPIDEKRSLDQHGVGVVAREPIGIVVRDRKERWRLVLGKRRENIDGGRPKLRQGPAAANLTAEQRLAEILEHDKAAVEIEGVDRGRGQSGLVERDRKSTRL